MRFVDRLDRITITAKQPNDFVSEVDMQAEQEIIRTLRRSFPQHAILAEESGLKQAADEDYQWIIDPLDGTTNFIHGLPHFAVSIALQYRGRMEIGVIYDPVRQEMFTAARGQGAYINEQRRLRVSTVAHFDLALLGTGFPFRHPPHIPVYLAMLNSLFGRCAELRRAGSAALDLAYVAAGRLDGFWEMGLNAWDIAAGSLLVQEAGGLVSDLHGGNSFMDTGHIVAANPKIFRTLLKHLEPHLPSEI